MMERMSILRYQTRYDAYIGLMAKLQANHSRFARKDLKDISVINYLNSVYYTNGLVSAKCNFNDNITVLSPVAIGLKNESFEYNGDLKEILDLFDKKSNSKLVSSIKIRAKDLRFSLEALYPTTAKQFKIYADAIVDVKRSKIYLKMNPVKPSTSVKTSEAEIQIYAKNGFDEKGIFRFNIAMMIDVLKFYTDDDFIVIRYSTIYNPDSDNYVSKFELRSYDNVNDNLVWTFKDISISHMNTYLRKNKS